MQASKSVKTFHTLCPRSALFFFLHQARGNDFPLLLSRASYSHDMLHRADFHTLLLTHTTCDLILLADFAHVMPHLTVNGRSRSCDDRFRQGYLRLLHYRVDEILSL
jgi:hypothetical protein